MTGARRGLRSRSIAAALALGTLSGCAAVASRETGLASWYGLREQGRPTASGAAFDMHRMTAAHPSLPLGTRVRVTNLENGRTVVVRITDRGPYVAGRVIDLSYAAARALGMLDRGVARVRLEVLSRTD